MITKPLKKLVEDAASWPLEDQRELAEYAREIGARRTGMYKMSDDERLAVAKDRHQRIGATSSPTSWSQMLTNATDDEGSIHSRGIFGAGVHPGRVRVGYQGHRRARHEDTFDVARWLPS